MPLREMHVLPWFQDVELNLLNETQMKGKLPALDRIVAKVDEEDPWVLNTFSISGPGEGTLFLKTNH